MFNLLRLDLQFHAADTGADGGSAPGDTGRGGDQQTQTQQTQQTPSAQPQQTQTPPAQPPQPEPPKVDTKEIRNKAQADLLKKLGFENVDALQEVLTKYKEIEDSQKTEFQKQAEKLQELETNFSSVSEENATLKAQISAMKAGVKADAVEDVVVLAKQLISDDVDMDAAIKRVLEKYPQFGQEVTAQQQQEPPKPQFTQGQHNPSPQQTELEKWLAAFKK